MHWDIISNKILAFYRLMRIDKPIGTLLLLWPTLWALWIATQGLPSLYLIIIFVIGVLLTRALGCVINDYVDRNLDGCVKRTAGRPMPSGEISEKEASTLFVVLAIMSFLLVLMLNIMTILISVFAITLACLYPFMKRYIHMPQLVLGTAFSCSILMAFLAVRESIPLTCWLIFLANILWTISYDTQYAMMDREDDLKIGIKSTAILFGHKDNLIIGVLQITTLIIMLIIGYLNELCWTFYLSVLIAGLLFIYQHNLILKRENNAYFKAFTNNNYVGMVIFLGIAINYSSL